MQSVHLNWLVLIINVKIHVKDRVVLVPNAMSLVTQFHVCAHHLSPVIHSFNVFLKNRRPSIRASPAHVHQMLNVYIEMV